MESIALRFYQLSEWVACSRSSDSGVRNEIREREKNKGKERSWKEEGNFALTSYLTPIAVFLFYSHLFAPSPRSDRLEQVRVQKKRGCMDAW